MSDSDSDSDEDAIFHNPTESFSEDWSEYQQIKGFQLLEPMEFENGRHVRLLTHRRFYCVTLDIEPMKRDWERYLNSIGHHKKDLWSTYWLDIIFNSKCGHRKDIICHDILIDDLLPRPEALERPRKAYPSFYYIGYYHFMGDWRTVYFLCSIASVLEPTIKRSFMIALLPKERKRLLRRIQFNSRYATNKWLMENWK
jgi:hypothetical protein